MGDSMSNFKRKNELGIEFDCQIVAYTSYEGEEYIIYTDFLNDENGELRLFCAKKVEKRVVKISEELSRYLIDKFKKDEEKIYKESLVMIQ